MRNKPERLLLTNDKLSQGNERFCVLPFRKNTSILDGVHFSLKLIYLGGRLGSRVFDCFSLLDSAKGFEYRFTVHRGQHWLRRFTGFIID